MAIKDNKNKEILSTKNIWIGDPDARVSLVLYGDYESEECARVHKIIVKLLDEYGRKLKFNYRHFPLTQIHQHAHKAAEAAVAAAQEGKFWPMHNLIFAHHRRLGSISLREYAREAGVMSKNFLPDLVESKYGWTVRADLLAGLEKGVRTVPTIFINDRLYTSRFTFPELSKAIDAEYAANHRKRA
jgi:protein-disulfide isomerase